MKKLNSTEVKKGQFYLFVVYEDNLSYATVFQDSKRDIEVFMSQLALEKDVRAFFYGKVMRVGEFENSSSMTKYNLIPLNWVNVLVDVKLSHFNRKGNAVESKTEESHN